MFLDVYIRFQISRLDDVTVQKEYFYILKMFYFKGKHIF